MYNLRYHIASLVSVFLALALGLILGGLTVGSGMVEQQEKSLVEGLQKEFAQLRDENRDLGAENQLLTAFTDDTIEAWSATRLENRTVLVLSAPGLDGSLDAVRQSIEAAGGRIAVVTLLKSDFGLADEDTSAHITSLAPDPEAASVSIAASMAAEWLAPGASRPLTAALVEAGVLRVDGLEDDTVVSAFINLAGADTESDPAGVVLMRTYADLGLITIGAESPEIPTGVATQASRLEQSAMDTLGTSIGRYTLVSMLSGESSGYFGTGQGAEDPYPAVTIR